MANCLLFLQEKVAEALAGSDCAGGSLFLDPHPRPPQQRNSFGGGDRGGRGVLLFLLFLACLCACDSAQLCVALVLTKLLSPSGSHRFAMSLVKQTTAVNWRAQRGWLPAVPVDMGAVCIPAAWPHTNATNRAPS